MHANNAYLQKYTNILNYFKGFTELYVDNNMLLLALSVQSFRPSRRSVVVVNRFVQKQRWLLLHWRWLYVLF